MTEEQKVQAKLAVARIKRELRELREAGVSYQLVFDSEHPDIVVFYTDPVHRMVRLREADKVMREFVQRVEGKGMLNKPELIQEVVKFKQVLNR